MKLLISTLLALGTLTMASPVLAVDNSISALCRADAAGNTYQRPGGFCDAVASNKSLAPTGSASNCPGGMIKVSGHCVWP